MNDSSSILLNNRSDCVEAVKTLVLGCVGRLHLVTQRLEPDLYNHAEIYDHLSGLAASNRNTEIHIIAQDTRVAANQGHYLINLAQKLPTYVKIRTTVTPLHRSFRESWLIADNSAYLRLRNPDRYEGYYEIDNRLESRSYLERFTEMWEASEPDQNTRRLSL
jgi:hypothetical protein